MSRDEAFRYRLFNWRGEVHVVDPEIACTRIEDAWLEAGGRQLHERMSLANRDCFGHRHDLSHKLARGFAGESQRGFDFSVLRKVFCVGKIEGAARRFKPIITLLSALQSIRYLMNVAQKETRRIDQNATPIFRGNLE